MNKEESVKVVFILLFIIFITIYISQATGYYEYELFRKTELTKEQIKQFEEDIKNNKNIDVTKYIENDAKKDSNEFSKIGSNFSNVTSKYIKKGINEVFKIINRLIT